MSTRDSVIKACKEFQLSGWTPGTSGSIALLCNVAENSKKIFITPEGVRKDELISNELFELRDLYGSQECIPPMEKRGKTYRISSWAQIHLEILTRLPGITCTAFFAPKWTVLAARTSYRASFSSGDSLPNVLRLAYWGLIEHIAEGHEVNIPIISGSSDNPGGLLDSLRQALSLYPDTPAVVIRDYGMLVWADSLSDLKSKTEIIERLSELKVFDYHLVTR